jgi:hypothetical protein
MKWVFLFFRVEITSSFAETFSHSIGIWLVIENFITLKPFIQVKVTKYINFFKDFYSKVELLRNISLGTFSILT